MTRATQTRKPRPRRITGGVDTHANTHHAAVVSMTGHRITDAEFPATQQGYTDLLTWLRSVGRLVSVGVEGTGSYGKALARHLHQHGVQVVEITRPERAGRRQHGKSDPLDAYAAAEAVLAGKASVTPKLGSGTVESLRALHVTRAGAVKTRTLTINELRALLVTAPASLRERLHGQGPATLITACARLRPGADLTDPVHAIQHALRALARRYQALTREITDLDTRIQPLVETACPALIRLHGVGYETAAQLLITAGDNPDRIRSEASFAALCGVAPIPASSGQIERHRLSHGGDRQANRALYLIACTRLATDAATRAYRDRRLSDPNPRATKSSKEVIRCLKRYIARTVYKALTSTNADEPNPAPVA
jgi:transposase